MTKRLIPSVLAIACCLFAGCSKKDSSHTLKVAATAVPQGELLTFAQKQLKDQGIDLDIVIIDDYNVPNRALAEKEVDANFFQHVPFLENQMAQHHYSLEVLAKIEIEPMGVYSKKAKNIDALSQNGVIAVPNDPSNEARALILLSHFNLIQLNNPNNLNATILSIAKNPKNFKFQEVDAPLLPRALDDVDAAAIPTNFALQAGLSPLQDALIIEDSSSPYVNVIVIRKGDENDPRLQALKKVMTSQEMKDFIQEKYKGAVIPVF